MTMTETQRTIVESIADACARAVAKETHRGVRAEVGMHVRRRWDPPHVSTGEIAWRDPDPEWVYVVWDSFDDDPPREHWRLVDLKRMRE